MSIKKRIQKLFRRKKADGRNKIWTTKDGYKIRIKDLGDDHLINIIRFLERSKARQDNMMECVAGMFSPDSMAAYYAESAIEHAMKDDTNDRFPIYADLEQEARRRGILQGVSR